MSDKMMPTQDEIDKMSLPELVQLRESLRLQVLEVNSKEEVYKQKLEEIVAETDRITLAEADFNEKMAIVEEEMTNSYAMLAAQKQFTESTREQINTLKKFTPTNEQLQDRKIAVHEVEKFAGALVQRAINSPWVPEKAALVQDLEQEKSKVAATKAEIEQVRAEKEQLNDLVAEHKKLPFTEVCVKLGEYITKMNSYRGVLDKEQKIFDQLKADQLNATFAEEESEQPEVQPDVTTMQEQPTVQEPTANESAREVVTAESEEPAEHSAFNFHSDPQQITEQCDVSSFFNPFANTTGGQQLDGGGADDDDEDGGGLDFLQNTSGGDVQQSGGLSFLNMGDQPTIGVTDASDNGAFYNLFGNTTSGEGGQTGGNEDDDDGELPFMRNNTGEQQDETGAGLPFDFAFQ